MSEWEELQDHIEDNPPEDKQAEIAEWIESQNPEPGELLLRVETIKATGEKVVVMYNHQGVAVSRRIFDENGKLVDV